MRNILYLIIFVCSLFTNSHLFAQTNNMVVKGTVSDQNETLPGVTIILVGSNNKSVAVTDVNGNFSAKIPIESTLLFRYIGFKEQRIKLKPGQVSLNVKLVASDNLMDEVVVRGYQQRSREQTTGSSFIITGSEIQDIPVSNAEELLQGKVAGLNIQVNTGAPGYRGSVAIRGLSSIGVSGSGAESFLSPSSPLYVIDGIPVDADTNFEYGFESSGPGVSPLSMIPPEDIQSIEVLKDAQATSLYGSKGAFGVIIITTVRGNSKVPRVRYTSNFFLNAVPKLRETLGGISERNAKINQIYNYGTYNDIIRMGNTPILSDSLNPYFNNTTDWQSVFYKSTYNQTHNLAIDGGDQKFNYKANFGYYGEKGIIKNTGFNRYNATLNMDYRPSDKLKIFINMAGGVGKQNKGDGLGVFQSGVATNSAASSLLPGPSLFLASSGVVSALNVENDNASRNLRTNAEVRYLLFEGFNVTSSGSYDFSVNTEETFTPAAANNRISKVYSYNDRKSTLYNRNALTYSKSINDKHNFFVNTFNEVYVYGFQAGYIYQVGTANDQIQGPIGPGPYNARGGGVLDNYRNENVVSFATSFSYDFMKKYVLDFTYRWDASSLTGFDNPYQKNPSIGLRWNFYRENLFESADWLTFGDIRLSWGRNIQPAGNIFKLYGTYQPNGNYLGNPRIGINYDYVPNSTLSPVTNTTYNFGFDLGLFNSALEITYDTYYKDVTNLQRDLSLPTTAGFSKVLSDGASIVNYGHELSITTRPLPKSSKVNLSLSVNGAINHDVLTGLPGQYNQIVIPGSGSEPGTSVLRVGRNTLSNFIYNTNGVYSTDAQVPVNPVTGLPYRTDASSTSYFKAGDPMFEDIDGDYILTINDRKIMGNSQPLVVGGMSAYVTYKNYSLNINGSYTFKRDIMNDALASRLRLVRDPFGSNVLLPLNDVNYWKQLGDVAKYPNPYDFNRANAINPFRAQQSLFMEDGSYFKLNTVSFSYRINKSLAEKLRINGLRVYVSANNLVTFSPYSGPNPENVTALGYDASGGYPVSRRYNLGLNIEF